MPVLAREAAHRREERCEVMTSTIKTIVRGDRDGWGCQYRNGRVTVFSTRKKAEGYCGAFAGKLVRVKAEPRTGKGVR